ncbi:endocuticle structural glycoprotein ABD-5 [Drosophila albomicans]|uniref:Endocuticle structural glycoprotein ABD-5 n=1 Tax=Drosophila albomicans TaxID=7291 RepID=A0A6P8YPT5_DROAB|nr:endocuticle structural glycoprotein ABD-5 [Drosophila albomicans]
MFKLCLSVFVLYIASALAAPVEYAPPVAILDSINEKNQDGSYHFFYQSEDGTHREETAVVVDAGTENEHLEISGNYSYYDADGKEVVVNYKANDHGFVPEGGSISKEISLAAKQASEAQYVPETDYQKPPKF